MIVFHGSTLEIQRPDIYHSKSNLDFGVGFYVTSNKTQAERWSLRKSMRFGGVPTVSCYNLADMSSYNLLTFTNADAEWLEFVVNCRNGSELYKQYDAVMGKVANDDVFKCVSMYMDGHWSVERTLEEIRFYKNYDQIAFISQSMIDNVLKFTKSYEVTHG